VVGAVTGERTIAASGARADVLNAAVGGSGHVAGAGVEVHQMLSGGDTVGIVAGGAGGLLVHDMKPMAAILIEAVGGFETVIGEDAVAAVAFVTERVIGDVLGVIVRENQLAFEQGCVGGPVRTFRAGAARAGALVVVVAVGAIHPAAGRPRRDETGHAAVPPDGFDGMERAIAGLKFQAGIGLHELPVHFGRPAPDAVRVTAEAKLVFIGHRIDR